MADGPFAHDVVLGGHERLEGAKKVRHAARHGGSWSWSNDSQSIYMRVLEGQPGVYRLTIPDGGWTKVSGAAGSE